MVTGIGNEGMMPSVGAILKWRHSPCTSELFLAPDRPTTAPFLFVALTPCLHVDEQYTSVFKLLPRRTKVASLVSGHRAFWRTSSGRAAFTSLLRSN